MRGRGLQLVEEAARTKVGETPRALQIFAIAPWAPSGIRGPEIEPGRPRELELALAAAGSLDCESNLNCANAS